MELIVKEWSGCGYPGKESKEPFMTVYAVHIVDDEWRCLVQTSRDQANPIWEDCDLIDQEDTVESMMEEMGIE